MIGIIQLRLSNSSDSVTIVIVSVTITTVMAKTAIVKVDMWLRACAFDIVLYQHTHNSVKKHVKILRNSSCEINLDKELQVFLLESSKSNII